ncbi:MAG: T9SS type A sorting domain-containing protein [Bacteroidales bacterium]|jgi:hypothetical protein|nr:T9SS type A sorting domain-containing protein [Bacteroidales bacterium]
MNKKFLIQAATTAVLALLLNFSGIAQMVFSDWIATLGTPGWDLVNDMTGDASGAIYITGSYTDTTISTRSSSLAANTIRTMYVAKIDSSGKIIWNKNVRNCTSGFGSMIARGKDNQVILAGGEEISNKKKKLDACKSVFFISSLNPEGTVNWTQNFTGSKFDYLTSMVVDTLYGEIMITGYFHDTLRIRKQTYIARGLSDGIILRFDLNGAFKSARVLGGGGDDKIHCTAIDSLGNHYIAGIFQRKIQFEKDEKNGKDQKDFVLELNNRRERGLFLAKYNHEGEIISAKHLASGEKIKANSVLSIGDLCFIAGSFSDNMLIGDQVLHSRGSDDIFLLCLDRELKIKWYKQIGGMKKDRASKVIQSGNEIILSGSFTSSIDFDQITLTASGNGSDVFLLALDFSGNLKWMQRAGGEANDYATCMMPGSKGYIYLAGSFRQTFALSEKTLQSAGEEDIFICRLENCSRKAPVFKQPEYLCEGSRLQLDAGEGFTSYDWANGMSRERTFNIDHGGEYPLELISPNGCYIYDTIEVVEIARPVINLGNDTIIADTARLVLQIHEKYARYLWNNGLTSPVYVIKGEELHEGPNLISLTVMNERGCPGYDDIVITMTRTSPNKISEIISGSCILFPNPTQDLVTLYFSFSFKSLELSMYDPMGKEVLARPASEYLKNTHLEFNLGAMPKGLYTLSIKTERGDATKKIILQ